MVNIQSLQYGYKPKKPLFSNLNLHLEQGHIYGLLGKNGAGKSTLLRNMTGLAIPDAGQCLFKGQDVAKRSVATLGDVYFLPEDIYLPAITPAQYAANTGAFYPAFSTEDYFKYLEMLEIDRNVVLSKQSHGQQKKSMIAFALATNTSLLVLDEPTNGLDIPSKVQFRKLMASVLHDDKCIIISTHQVRDLDSLIDTVIMLHNNQILLHAGIDTIAEQLLFTNADSHSASDILYKEEGLLGRNAIVKNKHNAYGKVELELLFNALTTGHQSILDNIKSN